MLTCKQVSNALADKDYASLSPVKRAALKLHVALCAVCGRYNHQVMIMQDATRNYRTHEDIQLNQSEGETLSGNDKQAIKEALRKAQG